VRASNSVHSSRQSLQEQLNEATREARDLRGRLAALQRDASALMWSTGPDGHMRDAEHWCNYTGQLLVDARGVGWMDAIHPDDRQAFPGVAHEAIAHGSVFAMDCRIRRYDGVYRIILMRLVPVTSATGEVREWAGIGVDITERASAAAILRGERDAARAHVETQTSAGQRMDEFLAVATHDLKAPLTSSKSYVQLAMRRFRAIVADSTKRADIELVKDLQQSLERADHSLTRVNRLASRLLDMSRIRAGKLELSMRPTDLVQLVRQLVEDQRHVAPRRVIHLEAPASQPISALADADRISQAVTNLLTNALRYSPARRPIVVAVDTQADVVRVSVRDEGRGVRSADLPAIWRRFEQAPRTKQRTTHEPGLGLGLYITKSIVEAHRGQVGVESQVGRGSTFWFTLPLTPVTR
jgi:PAS domain S-box-containing protein